MTKVNLKDNIFIEGFDDINKFLSKENKYNVQNTLHFLKRFLIYSGKTSEIPEDLAKECVIQFGLCKGTQLDDGSILQEDIYFGFKNYKPGFGVVDFETPKESIQSACDKEYCIIYKTK